MLSSLIKWNKHVSWYLLYPRVPNEIINCTVHSRSNEKGTWRKLYLHAKSMSLSWQKQTDGKICHWKARKVNSIITVFYFSITTPARLRLGAHFARPRHIFFAQHFWFCACCLYFFGHNCGVWGIDGNFEINPNWHKQQWSNLCRINFRKNI